jgi:hypothetical protein
VRHLASGPSVRSAVPGSVIGDGLDAGAAVLTADMAYESSARSASEDEHRVAVLGTPLT